MGVNHTYTPADYLGAHTIFRTKGMAEYWLETRVHKSNTNAKVIPVEIVYKA